MLVADSNFCVAMLKDFSFYSWKLLVPDFDTSFMGREAE